jgi:uncharacterized protein (TIRG00374 family)
MIGFMLNCILPARIGELARPAIFYKKEKVPFAKVLATVGAERVFDVLVLLISFVIVLASVEISPTLDLTFGEYHLNKAALEKIGVTTLQLCLGLMVCIALVSVKQSHKFIRHTILSLPRLVFFAGSSFKEKVRERLCMRLVRIFDNLAAGFDLLKSPKKVALCLGLSFVVWAVAGSSYYVMSLGCPGIDLSFLELYATMVILCFFISLPSAPGFWGIWEAGGVSQGGCRVHRSKSCYSDASRDHYGSGLRYYHWRQCGAGSPHKHRRSTRGRRCHNLARIFHKKCSG